MKAIPNEGKWLNPRPTSIRGLAASRKWKILLPRFGTGGGAGLGTADFSSGLCPVQFQGRREGVLATGNAPWGEFRSLTSALTLSSLLALSSNGIRSAFNRGLGLRTILCAWNKFLSEKRDLGIWESGESLTKRRRSNQPFVLLGLMAWESCWLCSCLQNLSMGSHPFYGTKVLG